MSMEMSDSVSAVGPIKAKANELMKAGKYLEAIMQYSEGISIQPTNPLLYSNRSLAFLKMAQHFFALKDAETTIRLIPDWAKGYYRKGQAELSADMFESAIATFQQGLSLCPSDEMLQKAMAEAKSKEHDYIQWTRKCKIRYIMLSTLIGLSLIILDMWKPGFNILRTPSIRVFILLGSILAGYMVAYLAISIHKSNKAALLQPPPELLTGYDPDYNPVAAAVSSSKESFGVSSTTTKSD